MLNGRFIGVKEAANTFVVERKFTVGKIENAVLKATALGLYFAEINGLRVGDSYLMPGWTSYNKTLQVQEYDVTGLIKAGENTVRFTVGEGWYSGEFAWDRRRNYYGGKTAVLGALKIGNTEILTDESWTAHESDIKNSSIYDGESVDFTAAIKPLTVCVVEFDKRVLVKQMCESVRDIERIPVAKMFRTPKGELVYDFGQNLTGVVEIMTPDSFEGTLTLQFAEILVGGNFYTENLRSAKATDVFKVSGARRICPEFTFHGFRYMKLEGGEIPAERVTAIVRHTDMVKTGKISTSNERFNRLLKNVEWGQRDNFVDIPTDCPQRDERLGWTGDINVFCRTAAFNYDVRGILKKWLNDARNDQAKTGEIPHVIPDRTGNATTAAMWSDAITMVPWVLYEMYGDVSFLSENFAAMCKFIEARERTMENGLIVRGHEYGDWLALDGELVANSHVHGRTDAHFITNVLHTNTLSIAAASAKILGDKQSEKIYKQKRATLLKNIRHEYFTGSGRLAFDTVTAEVLALHFNIVPASARNLLAKRLNENVIKHGYCVTTGFIGTPYLLFALSDNGYFETAARVLLNNAFPGWLYEVDMGATTIWERWNSLLPDGTPNPDGMNSYNHYAYGSVMEFVYRRVAGIESTAPGFKKVKIAPNPVKGLAEVAAEYDSVNGKIEAGYKSGNGTITFFARVPKGITAEIYLPNEGKVASGSGEFEFTRACGDLNTLPYTPESTVAEVFNNPKAVEAFNQVFDGIFSAEGIMWMKNNARTLQFMAEFLDSNKKMKLSDFPNHLRRANEIFLKLPR